MQNARRQSPWKILPFASVKGRYINKCQSCSQEITFQSICAHRHRCTYYIAISNYSVRSLFQNNALLGLSLPPPQRRKWGGWGWVWLELSHRRRGEGFRLRLSSVVQKQFGQHPNHSRQGWSPLSPLLRAGRGRTLLCCQAERPGSALSHSSWGSAEEPQMLHSKQAGRDHVTFTEARKKNYPFQCTDETCRHSSASAQRGVKTPTEIQHRNSKNKGSRVHD